jgi:hypothetical protein
VDGWIRDVSLLMELHVKNLAKALANYIDGSLGDETKRQEANAAHTMVQTGSKNAGLYARYLMEKKSAHCKQHS